MDNREKDKVFHTHWIERLNFPPLTRVWMEGNLRWLVHVLLGICFVAGLAALYTHISFAHFTIFFIAGTLVTFFLYKFTGLSNGLFIKPISALPAERKNIALTFDDGPNSSQTEIILEILEQHQVSASFFLTGRQIDKHPQLAQKIAAKGHDIGSHGYSHRNLRLAGPSRLAKDFSAFDNSLANAGIKRTNLFRPPHGAKSPLLEAYLKRQGYKLILWNLSPKDWKTLPPGTILQRLQRHTTPGAIVLLHDTENAVAILPRYIEITKKAGYRFRKISEFT